jgi:hypothetical protein
MIGLRDGVPALVCDHCGGVIDDAHYGVYGHRSKARSYVHTVHRRCKYDYKRVASSGSDPLEFHPLDGLVGAITKIGGK